MTTFTGTIQKCKACDKTVHFVEMVSADGICFHKTCFRCSECNGKLASDYSQLDGKLYCMPHYQQLFRRTGSFTQRSLSGRLLNPDQLPRTPSKAASAFTGTKDKCAVCEKVVFPLDKVSVEGDFFHKTCFRCAHGGCNLTTSSYAALDGILYCKPHYSQLFKEKGCYNHLTKKTSLKRAEAAALLKEAESLAKEAEDFVKQPDNTAKQVDDFVKQPDYTAKQVDDFVNQPENTTKNPDSKKVSESEPVEPIEQAKEEEVEPEPQFTENVDHSTPKEN